MTSLSLRAIRAMTDAELVAVPMADELTATRIGIELDRRAARRPPVRTETNTPTK